MDILKNYDVLGPDNSLNLTTCYLTIEHLLSISEYRENGMELARACMANSLPIFDNLTWMEKGLVNYIFDSHQRQIYPKFVKSTAKGFNDSADWIVPRCFRNRELFVIGASAGTQHRDPFSLFMVSTVHSGRRG